MEQEIALLAEQPKTVADLPRNLHRAVGRALRRRPLCRQRAERSHEQRSEDYRTDVNLNHGAFDVTDRAEIRALEPERLVMGELPDVSYQMRVTRHELPDMGYQAIPHFILILPIARQVPCQKFFLVEQSPYQRGHDHRYHEHPPPRTECDRYAEQHDKGSRIHRVPHQRVRAG